MKLTFILLTVVALQVSAKGFTQTISLSVKDAPLEKVFESITNQSGFRFFYNEVQLQKSRPVTIQIKEISIEEALNICLKDQPFTFAIVNKVIVIKERIKDLAIQTPLESPSLVIDIKGRVVNENNEPVEGANIKIKGTDKGTNSNDKGEFTLEQVNENSVLEISHISYETQEMAVNSKTNIRVSLKAKVGKLTDVIINTGYQTLRQNEVTGSVTTIRKEQLDQRVAPDIISKLEGITNGLVFNKDPLTGRNQLRVRGENTIYGYAEPLIVVDNFPYDGDITEINPNDVESITVLKDAAAASIWGVRAGNGVIVITTKKGRTSHPLRIEINANTTLTEKPDLFYSPNINPSDYIDYEIYLFSQGAYNSRLNTPRMIVVSPVVEILNNRKKGLISANDSSTQINALRNNDWRNEYLKHLYRTAINQQYQINLSGGGEKAAYYFSGGYDKNLGVLEGYRNDRITFSNRTSYNPIKGLEIQAEINYVETNLNSNGSITIPNIYPYMKLEDNNGNALAIPQRRKVWEDTITKHGFLNWQYFPLEERKLRDNKTKDYTTRIGTQIRYTFIKGLSAAVSYQYYRSIAKSSALLNKNSYYIRNQMNRFAILDANKNYIGTNYPLGGQLDIANSEIVSHNGRFKLDYKNGWGDHEMNVVAGADVRELRSGTSSSRFLGYDDENRSFSTPNTYTVHPIYPVGAESLGGGNALGLSNSGSINRYRSFFGNALYMYKRRYSLSGSARLDQANIFGVNTNQKGTPLWSVGGKWEISKEKFYNLKTFSNLGLRVNYGYQGNLSPDAVAIVTLKYNNNPGQYTGLPTAVINNFPNPELRWEKLGQLNIGIDFSLRSNALNGTIEYFKKRGTDLIGNSPLDITTGVRSLKGNFSDLKSTGIDVLINYRNISTTNFNWSSTFLFNYAAEKITRYDEISSYEKFLISYYLTAPKVGYPIRSIFSYRWGGLDPNTGDSRIILGDTVNKSYGSSTTNNITFDDLVYNGRYNPPIAGSISNTLSWKGLSLTFNITYKFGHYFRRSSIKYTDFEFNWMAGHKDFALRWQKPGDEVLTDVPSFIYPNPSSTRDDFYLLSTALIEKADHIRLNFVNLGYELNNSLTQRIGLQNLSIYFYANNLGILWRANKLGIDPDYPYMNYPPSRSFSVGIKTGL